MSRLSVKNNQAQARVRRVRARVSGDAKRPRLVVNISNNAVSAQLIDDVKGVTIGAVSPVNDPKKTMTEKAVVVGEKIAEVAKKNKIEQAILDRRSKKFHGRLKALTEAANEKGLKV